MTAPRGEPESVTYARTALRPSVRAAITTQAYSKQLGELDLTAVVDELATQNAALSKGDMARSEAMLLSHAHTLDAIFHELVRRAGLNMGKSLDAVEIYMRLGLRAQGQCRATLQTLAEIKEPASRDVRPASERCSRPPANQQRSPVRTGALARAGN
jgi:hypothetical protein